MKGYKKIIAISIAATLVYSYFTGITVYSSDEITKQEFTNVTDLQYEKKENSIWITGYTGSDEKISLPEKIEDLEVTNIVDNAFKGCKIKEVEIQFIKNIGEGAFLDASNLEKIEVSSKVLVKGDAFNGTNINTIVVNYGEEDITDKSISQWEEIVKKINGINVDNITGKFITNNEYTKNLDDLVGPVINLNGDAEINIEIGSQFVDLGATAYDEFEKVDTIVTSGDSVDTSKLGQYIVTYKSIDSSRNISTLTRKINVVDIVAPEIVLNGDNEITIEAGQKYEELGAIGIDKVDGTFKASVSGEVNISIPGEYILTYTATDNSGNSSTITRKVKVIDTTAPDITLNGKNEVTIEAGNKYEELGAIGKDIVDGELEATISGEVNTNKIGEYKLTYTVTDSSGNSAATTRKINVKDTKEPEIILSGKNEITLEAGTKYEELGATAKDSFEGKKGVKISGKVNANEPGNYTVTYTAEDTTGNKAVAIRKVKVVDTTSPIIIFNGDKEITIEAGTQYVEPGASGKDIVDGSVEVKISGVIDTGKVGEYKINYLTSDKAGNKASAVRNVKVVDTVAPIITLNGDGKINLEVGDKYEELGAVAKDKVDGMIPVIINREIDINKAGEYTITYKAIDNSKNESTISRKVKVSEKIVEGEDNEVTVENRYNDKLLIVIIISGVIILGGVVAGTVYYYKKRK